MTIAIPEFITVPTWLIVVAILAWLGCQAFWAWFDKFWNIYRVPPEGFVYLMRRADGIYKIGQTNDLKERTEALTRQYKQTVYLIASWPVPNVANYEAKALALTRHFALDDTELRTMTVKDAFAFVFVFSIICEKMATPKRLETIIRGWK